MSELEKTRRTRAHQSAPISCVVGVVSLSASLVGCGPSRPVAKSPPKPPVAPSVLLTGTRFNIQGGTIVESGKAGTVWKLHSASMKAVGISEVATITDADATLYENGKPVLAAHSPHVFVDYKDRMLRLDNASARSLPDGTRGVSADRVDWKWLQPDGLEATGHVLLRQRAVTVESQRLVADVGLRRAVLTGQPVATAPLGGI